jgi:superfamily II RNA helicase
MEFHGLTLDRFQVLACDYITNDDSVVVSAPTGTGKTLIAEYAIDFYTAHGQRSVYTSPIKALSNQKYKDFIEQFGKDRVGILTGDVSINSQAQILVMTTEVYRNMALTDPEGIKDVGLLILDEVHFMNDPERGTVWEESIIFSPRNVRFLALSATIPNAGEFAHWIETIHGHRVQVVEHLERAVPLYHYYFLGQDVIVDRAKLEGYAYLDHDRERRSRARSDRQRGRGKRRRKPKAKAPGHLDLVRTMKRNDDLPCLFFCFSRTKCESQALEVAHNAHFFKEPPEEILAIIDDHLSSPDIRDMQSINTLKQAMKRGVAFHHAGMLPAAKRTVEEAFGQNLIRVLYATETFAVGINYPARTVAFDSLKKYDGTRHRYLNSKEYFQMAGRAGRRGMDDSGKVLSIVDRWQDDLAEIGRLTKEDRIPIYSQFQLSYNTVLNLVDKHSKKEIKRILERSFETFRKRRSGRRVNVWTSWYNRVRTLEKLGHIRNGQLTAKGRFATRIFTEELVTAELFHDNKWKNWSVIDLACLGAAITYEIRHSRKRAKQVKEDRFFRISSSIADNKFLARNLSRNGLAQRIPIIEKWARGCMFKELVNDFDMAEGDLIRIFRQAIDVLEQVKRATDNEEIKNKLTLAVNMLDREVVSVTFD